MSHSAILARIGLFCLPVVFAVPLTAQSVELNFSSLGSALVSFDSTGSSLSFTPDASTGYDFEVGSSTVSGLVGYKGTLQGNFTIGPVTTSGFGAVQIEEASITGTGLLTLSDGTAAGFTAVLTWNSIVTVGTSGALNAGGATNITDFSYSGTNPILEELATDGSGTAVASFQFVPARDLDNLAAGSGGATTYSGSFEAIPEPRAYGMILGLLVLAGTLVAVRTRRLIGSPLTSPPPVG